MKKRIMTICLVLLLMLADVVLAGYETNRFCGASYDGYDRHEFIQTSTDPSVALARFKGNSYDGYAKRKVGPLHLADAGTIFLIR